MKERHYARFVIGHGTAKQERKPEIIFTVLDFQSGPRLGVAQLIDSFAVELEPKTSPSIHIIFPIQQLSQLALVRQLVHSSPSRSFSSHPS